MVCFLSCNQACSCLRALVSNIVRSHQSRSRVVSFFASAKILQQLSNTGVCLYPKHQTLAFRLKISIKRLFSPLLHSLCSHLFLHVIEVNCSLIKTVPSASISYCIIIIIMTLMTCCIFLLLKENWLCMSQGVYAGPSFGVGGGGPSCEWGPWVLPGSLTWRWQPSVWLKSCLLHTWPSWYFRCSIKACSLQLGKQNVGEFLKN